MANTKKEMLSAYNSLVKKLREKRDSEIKPTEKSEEKKIKTALEKTDALSFESLIKSISDLKMHFNKTVNELSEKLDDELKKYQNIQNAVEAKENELKDIFEIEKEASSLRALIDLQKIKREEFENETILRENEFNEEMAKKKVEWEEEKKQIESDLKERRENAKKSLEREKEEFRYEFEQEKKKTIDQFNTDKTSMERELKEKQEQAEKEFAEREKAISEAENELEELRSKVNEFEAILKSSVNKSVSEATEKIENEASYKEQMLIAKFEGEKQVFKTRIESLEKTIKDQALQLKHQSEQIEKSYSQVQNIAIKAVEGSNLSQANYESVRKNNPNKTEE